ncbi:MAG TPA: ABC transporter ATP-binding protein [Microbacteriaceae bacterium]|nr:ABC transporter ATP-binding protein [Microbacteriaceae bacterium]
MAEQSTMRSLLRLWPILGRERWMLLGSFIVALVAMGLSLAIPQALGWMIDGPIASNDPQQIWIAAGIILGLGVLESCAWIVRRIVFSLPPASAIETRLRTRLYARLQDLPVGFHDRWPSGQLLSRALSDIGTIRRWTAFGVVFFAVNVVVIIVATGILVWMSPLLGLLFLAVSSPIWVLGYRFEKKYSVSSRLSQDQAGNLATAVEESVHGIRILKAFGRADYSLGQFTQRARELRRTELEKARLDAGIWFWLTLLPALALGLILLVGVMQVAAGTLEIGTLVAFFATAVSLRWPVESIGFLYAFTVDTRTAVDRIFEILDEPNPIREPDEPARLDAPEGRVRFEDVVFRYPDAPASSTPLLDGVSLELAPGETVALVGLTGSGKSTVTSLMIRLFDVTSGRITIDGVDLRALSRGELRRHVAIAFEEPTLFSASVRDNVLLGRPDLVPGSDEAERVLETALRVAQAEFVSRLPDGLDTVIGEEGHSLSGGQRQRLALARAIAANPTVLVLDDPLSALDVETEERAQRALGETLQRTTTLVVAHRPSTVLLADRVALLEKGRIVAVGPHTELLANDARYRHVLSSFETEEVSTNER